jgi:hypothetical protein
VAVANSNGGQPSAAPSSASGAAAQKKKRWPPLAAAAVVLLAALIGGGLYYRSRKSRQLTEKDTIVVADFDNKTGDAVFDDTLKTGLTVALNQSPFLNVLADNRSWWLHFVRTQDSCGYGFPQIYHRHRLTVS